MGMKISELNVTNIDYPEHSCEGLIVRGFNSTFWSKGRIEQKKGFKILKRKSCSGCGQCGFLIEQMEEDGTGGCIDLPENITDGGTYEVFWDCQDDGIAYREIKN